jgi:hypothetical protein
VLFSTSQPELKARIDAWVKSKLAERRAAAAAAGGVVKLQ